jgi:cation transport ATPase
MAFDKTGTLVKAKPLVADVASLNEIAGDKSLQISALLYSEKGFK